MPEITLLEVGQAVQELRAELERKSVDRSKLDKINAFLDSHEEKVNQPLARAQLEAKQAQAAVAELKAALESKGADAGKARERIDALELELAARSAARTAPESKAEWKQTAPEYKALNDYCRKGGEFMSVEAKQFLRTDVGIEGGFLVPQQLDTEIVKQIVEIDALRSVARVRTVAGKTLSVPIRTSIPTATYAGENETGADSESLYGLETLTPFRQTYTVPVTLDLLQDAAFDMEAEIASDAAEAFAFGEGNGFVVGTGFKQPEGFLTIQAGVTPGAGVVTGSIRGSATGALLRPADVILISGDLKVGYNPVYAFNRRTLATIRTFRGDAASPGDGAGQFLWMPGLSGPVMSTLNGFPYILLNSMPDIAATARPLVFADFRRGYTIVDRTGISVIRDEFTLKKRGMVEFTMNRWNTGQVTLAEPIRILAINA
jgi:HK97 family phage major capsid protein